MGGVAGTCGLLAKTSRFPHFNPRNQARSASLGAGTDSDSICKEMGVEDVGAMTPCGKPDAMDSAHTPNTTSPMQLWNQSISSPRNQSRSAGLGEGADILISFARQLMLTIYGTMTLYGWLAAMNAA